MAVEIGTVVSLIGKVIAVDTQGNERTLQLGDIVYQGDEIITEASASVRVSTINQLIDISENNRHIFIDADTKQLAAVGTNSEINTLQQAILAGEDPTQLQQETIAGPDKQEMTEDQLGGENQTQLEHIAPKTVVESGIQTSNTLNASQNLNFIPNQDELIITQPDNSTLNSTPTIVSNNIDVNKADITTGDNSQGQLTDFGGDQPNIADQSNFQFTHVDNAPEGFTYTTSQDSDSNAVLTISQLNNDDSITPIASLSVDPVTGNYTAIQISPLNNAEGETSVDFPISYEITDSDGDTTRASVMLTSINDTPTEGTDNIDVNQADIATRDNSQGQLADFGSDQPDPRQNADITLDDDAVAEGNNDKATGDVLLAAATGSLDDDAVAESNNDKATGDVLLAAATGSLDVDFGPDGTAANGLSLLDTGAPEGFTYTLSNNGNTLTVSQDSHPSGTDIDVITFTLTDDTGSYSLQQLAAMTCSPASDENNTNFVLYYQAQDSDGDTAEGSIALSVENDIPNLSNTTIVSGTLNANIGADFTGVCYTLIQPSDDNSNNITYSLNPAEDTLTVHQGGNVVMIIAMNTTTGDYDVTQTGLINHPQGQDSLVLNISYSTTDSDGDSSQGTMAITVSDGVPIIDCSQNTDLTLDDATAQSMTLSADDDTAVVTQTAATASIGINESAIGNNISGVLAFNSGADGEADISSFTFTDSRDDNTADGFVYSISTAANGDQVLIIHQYDNQGNNPTAVASLVVEPGTGQYIATQLAAINNTGNSGRINFTLTYQVTDSSGKNTQGSVILTSNIDATLTVDSSNSATITLDGENVIGGNNDEATSDDFLAAATGSLDVDFALDGTTPNDLSLLSAGAPSGFTYTLSTDGNTLTISQNSHPFGTDIDVITFSLTDQNGGYSVQQLIAITHSSDSNEDNTAFTIHYKVHDGDDDIAQGSIAISVDDDTPNPVNTEIETPDNNNPAFCTLDANISADVADESYTLIKPIADTSNNLTIAQIIIPVRLCQPEKSEP